MHTYAATFTAMNLATKITMVAGYALAGAGLFGIVPALRNPAGRLRIGGIPHRAVVVAELLGTGCVTAGWFAAGSRMSNALNVAWLIACTTIWLRSENKRRLAGR